MKTLLALICALLLLGCAGGGPAGSPSAPPVRARVIVELTAVEHAEQVLALVPDATDVKQTEYSPYLIMTINESSIPVLRESPHVKQVSLDSADPPASSPTP